jgi:flavorubredoxin
MVFGSPTLNNNIFPTVADVLTYVKGLKPKNRIGAAFGSYGWSGESVKIIQAELESMGAQMIDSGLRIQYVPDQEAISQCEDFGRRIGDAVNG